MADEWYVYLVRCGDGTLYAGVAKDVERRVLEHESGRGAKYTRGRSPITLAGAAGPMPHGDALRWEMRLKKAQPGRKLSLLSGLKDAPRKW